MSLLYFYCVQTSNNILKLSNIVDLWTILVQHLLILKPISSLRDVSLLIANFLYSVQIVLKLITLRSKYLIYKN